MKGLALAGQGQRQATIWKLNLLGERENQASIAVCGSKSDSPRNSAEKTGLDCFPEHCFPEHCFPEHCFPEHCCILKRCFEGRESGSGRSDDRGEAVSLQ
jgi:hypothetical protein